MRENTPELLFPTRAAFRTWLVENAETSDGVWLIFGKTKAVVTLSANDALEEALCFGWIDGQMKSIDATKYIKYFARRRVKSPWSEKNKKIVETLREKGLMTELGESAITIAKQNGIWDAKPIGDDEIEALTQKIKATSPGYDNFVNLPHHARLTYARRHYSFKTEEARERDFLKIIDELNKM